MLLGLQLRFRLISVYDGGKGQGQGQLRVRAKVKVRVRSCFRVTVIRDLSENDHETHTQTNVIE